MFRMIADVWVGSALDQIFKTFPSLAQDGLNSTMDVVFTNNNTGAMAAMGSNGGPNFTLKINTRYFDPTQINNAQGSGGPVSGGSGELYDKIIAHEMMHGVMMDTMWPQFATHTIPDWFVEGSAEAVGGGHYRIVNTPPNVVQQQLGNGGLTDYSSGYAATMYLGYLAGGNNMNNIAGGLERIYSEMANGSSFSNALQTTIGMSEAQFTDLFRNPANPSYPNATAFVNDLRLAVASGAGSVLQPGYISESPAATIEDITGLQPDRFVINGMPDMTPATLVIQCGANSNQNVLLNRFGLSATWALGLPESYSLNTQASFNNAISLYSEAADQVSSMRAYYGAMQNRMEYMMANADQASINTQAAESRIRDTDMAKMMAEFTKTNLISQSATAMLAHANQIPNNVLSLLR
jgi:flagellin